jgi:hypothetical protein
MDVLISKGLLGYTAHGYKADTAYEEISCSEIHICSVDPSTLYQTVLCAAY